MSNYAIVGKVKTSPIEGAKTLQYAYYGGLPFVVGKDVNENDLYLIFMPDGQLSREYAEANDCIDRGKDDKGNKLGGYFGKNRKVRSLKLMGGKVTSVGYIADLSTLAFAGDYSKLKEGDVVDDFNDIPIARKFEVAKKPMKLGRHSQRKDVAGFLKHPDTKQFYQQVKDIEPGSLITLTLKLHGTSARYANLPAENGFWRRLFAQVGRHLGMLAHHYQTYAGTRNTILGEAKSTYYGSDRIWMEYADKLDGKLLPGESVYGEIVGWLEWDRPIQKAGGVKFTYGVPNGFTEFYVYNVRHQLPNGYSYDLSWEQVKGRCAELGLKYVPEMGFDDTTLSGSTFNQWADAWPENPFILTKELVPYLETLVYELTNGPDLLGDHIREGVVLRIEKNGRVYFLKSKSQDFYLLEDASKNAGESNIEEEV